MRSSISISILLLLLLPCSTSAIPVVTVPESVAGSSEARLGEAASPPSTSASLHSEPEAPPAAAAVASARPDVEPILSDDLATSLREGLTRFAQRIDEIWQTKDPQAAEKSQKLLDDLAAENERVWQEGREAINEKAKFLTDTQTAYQEFRETVANQVLEETAASISPDRHAAVREQLLNTPTSKALREQLEAAQESFLAARKTAEDQIDAVRLQTIQWIEKMSRERGTRRSEDPSSAP